MTKESYCVRSVPVCELNIDPKRFQFKSKANMLTVPAVDREIIDDDCNAGRFNIDSDTPLLTPEEDANDFQLYAESEAECHSRDLAFEQQEQAEIERKQRELANSTMDLFSVPDTDTEPEVVPVDDIPVAEPDVQENEHADCPVQDTDTDNPTAEYDMFMSRANNALETDKSLAIEHGWKYPEVYDYGIYYKPINEKRFRKLYGDNRIHVRFFNKNCAIEYCIAFKSAVCSLFQDRKPNEVYQVRDLFRVKNPVVYETDTEPVFPEPEWGLQEHADCTIETEPETSLTDFQESIGQSENAVAMDKLKADVSETEPETEVYYLYYKPLNAVDGMRFRRLKNSSNSPVQFHKIEWAIEYCNDLAIAESCITADGQPNGIYQVRDGKTGKILYSTENGEWKDRKREVEDRIAAEDQMQWQDTAGTEVQDTVTDTEHDSAEDRNTETMTSKSQSDNATYTTMHTVTLEHTPTNKHADWLVWTQKITCGPCSADRMFADTG